MSRHIVDDEQRRDRPQSSCAPRVSSGAGHLQRWRSSTMCTDIACVAPPCICPAALETRPLLILGQAPREPFLSFGVFMETIQYESTQRQDLVDDFEIVKSVQGGDSECFSLLVDKYHRHLLNFIYRLMGDEQIVEDIGQEVFLSVYKSIRSFNVGRGVPFSAWLFITARNRCISELRRKNRLIISTEGMVNLPVHEKTPEQTANDEERLLAIHAALEQLPEPYRQTILQSLRGDSPEEIARNNRISRGTVKSRLSRAREKMRLLLQERFGGNHCGRF